MLNVLAVLVLAGASNAVSLDPCQGAPVEIVFTVAEPDDSRRVFEEDARPRREAMARRRDVLQNGLDLPRDPATNMESFYPPHRVLLVQFRLIC